MNNKKEQEILLAVLSLALANMPTERTNY